MKLIRYCDESGGFSLDFHPLLTVVSGLPTYVRQHLIATVGGLPTGNTPSAGGELEVHGIRFDLGPSTYELLALNQDMDVVLRRADLPGAEPDPKAHIESSSLDADPMVVSLRSELEQCEQAITNVSRTIEGLRAQLGTIESERDALNAAIEPAASASAADLLAERERIQALRLKMKAELPPEYEAEKARVEQRINDLISKSEQAKRELIKMQRLDPAPVIQALRAVEISRNATNAGALGLADAIERNAREIHEWVNQSQQPTDQREQLIAQRTRLVEELARLSQAPRGQLLDPTAVAELESVHDELFAHDYRGAKSTGRKGKKLDELRNRERALLASMGFGSWSAYVMSDAEVGTGDVQDPTVRRDLETQISAIDEQLGAPAAPARSPVRGQELQQEQRALLSRAAQLLGREPDADVVAALRATPAPVDHTMALEDALSVLRLALESAGVSLAHREMSAEELSALAQRYVSSLADLGQRRSAMAAQRSNIEAEIAAMGERFEQMELRAARVARTPEMDQADRRISELDQQIAAAAELEHQRQSVQARQIRLKDQLRDIHYALNDKERAGSELAQRRAALLARLDAALTAESHTVPTRSEVGADAAAVEAVEWYVLARLAQQRSLSFVGSVPLMIDDAFADWRLNDLREIFVRLERMSEVIQIIYLTEDPDVIHWAQTLGDSAKVIAAN